MSFPITSSTPLRVWRFVGSLVVVTACSGASSAPADNPVPIISATTPAQLVAGAGISVVIAGSGFRTSTQARWNGQDRVTTIRSASSLTIELTASDLSIFATGTGRITAANPGPGGGISNPFSITVGYPVPVISSLSPATQTLGTSGFELFINGTGFSPSSVIRWNSTQLVTSFVSTTQLRTLVIATYYPSAGAYAVTVANPNPGGGTSAPATFSIQPF